MKRVFLILSIGTMLAVASCTKENVKPISNATEAMTVEDFALSNPIQEERNFLLNTPRTDNNIQKYESYLNNTRKWWWIGHLGVTFRWAGMYQGANCSYPLGLCFAWRALDGADPGLTPVKGIAIGKVLILLFPNDMNSNFGITSDGYLPILKDVSIPTDVATELGIDSSELTPKIASGIYKAYFNSTSNKYTGVIVTLK